MAQFTTNVFFRGYQTRTAHSSTMWQAQKFVEDMKQEAGYLDYEIIECIDPSIQGVYAVECHQAGPHKGKAWQYAGFDAMNLTIEQAIAKRDEIVQNIIDNHGVDVYDVVGISKDGRLLKGYSKCLKIDHSLDGFVKAGIIKDLYSVEITTR